MTRPTFSSSAAELSSALEKVIGRRIGKKALGFRAIADADAKEIATPIRAQRDSELLRQAEPQDLLKYGLIPEFVGRLPVLGILDELDEAALIDILTKPRNAILKQYAKLFDYEGVKVTFTDDAARAIAREALNRKVGARGLRMILEELMLDLMYHVPGNKKIKDLVITEAMVQKRGTHHPGHTRKSWLILALPPRKGPEERAALQAFAFSR